MSATQPADTELVRLQGSINQEPAAVAEQLRQRLKSNPLDAEAYRMLALALQLERSKSGTVTSSGFISIGGGGRLAQAARALERGDLPTAEIILRPWLRANPTDSAALKMMADLAFRLGFLDEFESLLRLAIEHAPADLRLRSALAAGLLDRNRPLDALAAIDAALELEPANQAVKTLKASILSRARRFEEATALFEDLLSSGKGDAKLWSSYGYTLKTMGRSKDGLAAMRKAIELDPTNGEAWWTLSNMKVAKLDDADIARIKDILGSAPLGREHRLMMHFAIGKAFEDAREPALAFEHYSEANRIRRELQPYEIGDKSREVDIAVKLFTRDFFDKRRGWGNPAPDPIFVVGMPRSGSTLVEQILASHPLVEGTMELADLPVVTRQLGEPEDWPEIIPALSAADAERMGREYLESSRHHRQTARPRFIDKMPNNWSRTFLIQLMLPNAKIVDARRHPMACGFSNFKQHFPRGQGFSNDLADMGRYYSDYVRLMAHVDAVMPGRVHRVIHEQLVRDTEAEIRRLLDYLELPFDERCLRFYETDRPILTPSSEQVRQPISDKGLDQWRLYEPFLQPLRDALGPVVDSYPHAPASA